MRIASTYAINASHSKKLSSLIGPATIPSGGFNVSSEIASKKEIKLTLTLQIDKFSTQIIFTFIFGHKSS